MPCKRQKRRSVSLRAVEYQRLKELSEATGEPCSSLVERLLRQEAQRLALPDPTRIDHLMRVPATSIGTYAGGYFTW